MKGRMHTENAIFLPIQKSASSFIQIWAHTSKGNIKITQSKKQQQADEFAALGLRQVNKFGTRLTKIPAMAQQITPTTSTYTHSLQRHILQIFMTTLIFWDTGTFYTCLVFSDWSFIKEQFQKIMLFPFTLTLSTCLVLLFCIKLEQKVQRQIRKWESNSSESLPPLSMLEFYAWMDAMQAMSRARNSCYGNPFKSLKDCIFRRQLRVVTGTRWSLLQRFSILGRSLHSFLCMSG